MALNFEKLFLINMGISQGNVLYYCFPVIYCPFITDSL